MEKKEFLAIIRNAILFIAAPFFICLAPILVLINYIIIVPIHMLCAEPKHDNVKLAYFCLKKYKPVSDMTELQFRILACDKDKLKDLYRELTKYYTKYGDIAYAYSLSLRYKFGIKMFTLNETLYESFYSSDELVEYMKKDDMKNRYEIYKHFHKDEITFEDFKERQMSDNVIKQELTWI